MTTTATAGNEVIKKARGCRIPELDGLRVIMIFIVSLFEPEKRVPDKTAFHKKTV